MIPDESIPHGFALPFSVDPESGTLRTSTGDRNLRHCLALLLQTEIGERVLRRGYGAGLRSMIHEPMNGAFLQLVKHQISQAVIQHEPRVQLLDSIVRPSSTLGELEVEVHYIVRRTQRAQGMRMSLPTRI
jgi:phage baseplate assembly protein W